MTRTLDICIVTCDIVGPIRNGGIGTAYSNLALALARAGHRVTVLYALGRYSEQRTIEHWRDEYARHGIDLVPLPDGDVQGHPAMKMSAGVYAWLKYRHFDVVHVHEWRGLGFYTALAKRQGLCLDGSVLCVGAHSPTLWHKEGMNELATAEDLEVDFMERQSVALADVFWSPSRYMVTWMRREGWRLPRKTIVKPNLLLDVEPATLPKGADRHSIPSELVFFGRLETRKGLDLFCDALDTLAARGIAPGSVTFLGKQASVGGVPSEEYLQKRASRWMFPWRITSDLDRHAAMAYLSEPGRLAVLPSRMDNLPYTVFECLGAGIPFVASAIGGIPELVRPADRRDVLFALTRESLSARLAAVLESGAPIARLRTSPAQIERDWLRWHQFAATMCRRKSSADGAGDGMRHPLVTVCVTHRNRPAFLAEALASIRRQDYPRIEVVLVDDGSDREDALAMLDSLAGEFAERNWTIIRQANRYLGRARNAAIAASHGTYILFMDDDNLAQPHEVSVFVRAAARSGADILTCFLHVFQSAKPVPERPPIHVWPFLGGAIAPGLLRNVFGDANAFVKRDVFDRIGGFTEDFGVGCEDWEFFARATLRGLRIDVVPEPLVLYRQSGAGMLNTTSQHANRMRALRPYLSLLPPQLRPLVHLARQDAPAGPSPETRAARLDHVQRAVVFGSGEAGRLAIGLARTCGWSVPWIVDNNPAAWDTTAHDLPVRHPASLSGGGFELVIVASLAGRQAIATQLTSMGFSHGEQFVHFLEPVRVGSLTAQVNV